MHLLDLLCKLVFIFYYFCSFGALFFFWFGGAWGWALKELVISHMQTNNFLGYFFIFQIFESPSLISPCVLGIYMLMMEEYRESIDCLLCC